MDIRKLGYRPAIHYSSGSIVFSYPNDAISRAKTILARLAGMVLESLIRACEEHGAIYKLRNYVWRLEISGQVIDSERK